MNEQDRRSLNLIFVAFFFSTLIYLFLGLILWRISTEPRIWSESRPLVFGVFLALSLVQVGILWFYRKRVDENSLNPENSVARGSSERGKMIVLFALSEVPAIFGIVYFLLVGDFFGQVLLTLISWICLIWIRAFVPTEA
jgi:hypothetical protein